MKNFNLILLCFALGSNQLFGMAFFKKSAPLFKSFKDVSSLQTQNRFIHIDKMKGLYHNLTPQAKKVSPVHGVGLMEGNFLINLYRYGNKDHATTKLVNDNKIGIFHLLDDKLRPTQNKSNPAYGLTPALTGAIIGALETNKLHDESVKNEIISALRKSYQQKTNDVLTKTKATDFINTIIQSAQENKILYSSDSYIKRIPHMILLAHLYRACDTKQEMIEYLKSLEQYMPVLKTSNDYDYVTKDNYKHSCTLHLNDEVFDNTYEQTVHAIVKQKEANVLPPQVLQGHYSFKNTITVPDCMETAFRNICNYIFCDGQSSEFSVDILPKNIQPRDSIKQFYTDFKSFNTANLKEAGQAWMNLISNLSGIIYASGNYEVKAFEENVIPLFNHLFNLKVTNLEELGKQLSDDRRIITFTKINDNPQKAISIEIALKNKLTNTDIHFIFHIFPNKHGCVEFPFNDSNNKINTSVQQAMHEKTLDHVETAQALFSLVKPNIIKMTDHFSLLCTDVDNPNDRLYTTMKIIRSNNLHFAPIALSLAQSLPDDHFYHNKVISCLFEQGTFISYFDSYIKQHLNGVRNIIREEIGCFCHVELAKRRTSKNSFEENINLALTYLKDTSDKGLNDLLIYQAPGYDYFFLPFVRQVVEAGAIITSDHLLKASRLSFFEYLLKKGKNRNTLSQEELNKSIEKMLSNPISVDYTPNKIKQILLFLLEYGAQPTRHDIANLYLIQKHFNHYSGLLLEKDFFKPVIEAMEKKLY